MLNRTSNRLATFSLPIALTLATILRLVYWWQVKDVPWFQTPGMDPAFYRGWAEAILAGDSTSFIPFPRGPLYPYILAGLWRLFGTGWLIARVFNLACDLFTITAVFRITDRMGGRRSAITAAILFGITGTGIYYSGEVLMTSLETMLFTLFVWCTVRLFERPRVQEATLTALVGALFSLCRPNGLAALGVVLLILAFRHRKAIKQIVPSLASYSFAALVVLSPVTAINFQKSGRILPVALQGGVNFYIGNSHTSNGWSAVLPGVGADWTDADAQRVAEERSGRALTPPEVSDELQRMGWEEIQSHPVDWVGLMGRKLILLLNIQEVGNNRPLTLPRESSPMLTALFLISFGSLIPFGLAGLPAFRQWREGAIALAALGGTFAATLLLFFVNTRYRMPLVPLAAVTAGVGVQQLITNFKAGNYRSLSFGLLLPGLILCLPPWLGTRFDDPAQGYFVTGNALLRMDRPVEAIAYYQKSAEQADRYPKLHLNLGVAYLAAGDTLNARDQFQKELRSYPNSEQALNNLGVIAERSDQTAEALAWYARSITTKPDFSDAIENFTRLATRLGDEAFAHGNLPAAIDYYQSALGQGGKSPRLLVSIAAVQATSGDLKTSRGFIDEALALDPAYLPALNLLREVSRLELHRGP